MDTETSVTNLYVQSEEDKAQQLRETALYQATDLVRASVVTTVGEFIEAAKRIENYLKTGE